MSPELTLLWAGILGFAVFMYVLMDGFDLGIGILFPFVPGESERDQMMDSVAPVWDGNETWLVLGGAGLMAAFPLAYGILLPALYLPLLLMLIALIFRGVAFEFRYKARTSRWLWNWAFFLGSLFATFAQGLVLGAFVHGFEVDGARFVGGVFDWLSPFSLFCGLALIAGYGLLGACWLILKTERVLQVWAYDAAGRLLILVVGATGVVSLWTPLLNSAIAERWFSWPNIALLSPVPLLTAALALALWNALRKRRQVQPFLMAMGLFLLAYAGLAISLWPNVVPPEVTLWEAASSPQTQLFLLVGVAILIPITLAYTAYSYYVFRGKVRAGEGYHH
ncbi:MAG TPA: cytochrome d ubiquinol oxidase subunit II [Alphaproteobacteria bacterium]|nr:cytochrome d ubiquinol oxidase subunit II [Alphaproteobacteria bacterium]